MSSIRSRESSTTSRAQLVAHDPGPVVRPRPALDGEAGVDAEARPHVRFPSARVRQLAGRPRSDEGLVALVQVVVQRAVSRIRLGPSGWPVAGRDRLGRIAVDPGAQAREHRGARRGGVARHPHDRDPGDVRLDLVPDRHARAPAGHPELGGRARMSGRGFPAGPGRRRRSPPSRRGPPRRDRAAGTARLPHRAAPGRPARRRRAPARTPGRPRPAEMPRRPARGGRSRAGAAPAPSPRRTAGRASRASRPWC